MAEDIAAIRAALLSILRDPTVHPGTPELRTYLVHGNWAQPHSWVDIFQKNRLRNEWRIAYRGEQYLIEHPPGIDD